MIDAARSLPLPSDPLPPPARRLRGWRAWIAPRPFTLVTTAVYGILLVVLGLPPNGLATGALLGLLALDRLDYWWFGERPPARAAWALLAGRVLLIEALGLAGGGWPPAAWPTALPYALLPYLAFLYLGGRGLYLTALPVWALTVARRTAEELGHQVVITVYQGTDTSYYTLPQFDWPGYIDSVVGYSLLLIVVISAARSLAAEQAQRARAEGLLAPLEHAHWQLRATTASALAAITERHRVARVIHDELGDALTAIAVQLETAVALRAGDPAAADAALGAAKHQAGTALQEVRRSVGTLHPGAGVPAAPALPPLPDGPRRGSGWVRWLAPRLSDSLPTAVYAAILIFYYAENYQYNNDLIHAPADLVFGGSVLGLLGLDRLEYRLFGEIPPRRAVGPLLAGRLGLVGLALASGGPWWGDWLVPLVIFAGFTYFDRRGGFIMAGLVAVGLVGLLGLVVLVDAGGGAPRVESVLSGLSLYSVALLLVVAVARTIVDERASRRRAEGLQADLRAASRQLQAQAGQMLTAWQDRNQLARDVHDSLGHYLTALNLQIATALAYRAVDPLIADAAVHNAQAITREALYDVRSTMGALQTGQDRFTLPSALERLCQRLAGSPVRLVLAVSGADDGFSQPALLALYRVAQEGLTNIQKHAQARQATLTLRFTADAATLDLTDDGRGFAVAAPATSEPPGGYGLQSMRERLEWVGGVLVISSAPGAGTRLHARVPRSPAEAGPSVSPARRPPELAVVAS